jgi:hypothetical protein
VHRVFQPHFSCDRCPEIQIPYSAPTLLILLGFTGVSQKTPGLPVDLETHCNKDTPAVAPAFTHPASQANVISIYLPAVRTINCTQAHRTGAPWAL